MRSIFEDRQVSIKCDDKYSYTVTKDGLAYVPGNGKPEVKVLFSEVGSTFLLNYCSSNGPYEITFKDNDGHNLVSIDTDLKLREFGHNILDTKTIILAFAANKLTTEFPNNLDTLNTQPQGEKDHYRKRCDFRCKASGQAFRHSSSSVCCGRRSQQSLCLH